jgi:hypothetical protein
MPARPHTIPQFTARAETTVERSGLNPGAPWNWLCQATSAAP